MHNSECGGIYMCVCMYVWRSCQASILYKWHNTKVSPKVMNSDLSGDQEHKPAHKQKVGAPMSRKIQYW